MESLWGSFSSGPLRPLDVAKLAVGQKEMRDEPFSTWEALLSEIIVGDAFGADRMDYLLRDSHHLGVAYGRFDHNRLIDTLRILPSGTEADVSQEPTLGVTIGGSSQLKPCYSLGISCLLKFTFTRFALPTIFTWSHFYNDGSLEVGLLLNPVSYYG